MLLPPAPTITPPRLVCSDQLRPDISDRQVNTTVPNPMEPCPTSPSALSKSQTDDQQEITAIRSSVRQCEGEEQRPPSANRAHEQSESAGTQSSVRHCGGSSPGFERSLPSGTRTRDTRSAVHQSLGSQQSPTSVTRAHSESTGTRSSVRQCGGSLPGFQRSPSSGTRTRDTRSAVRQCGESQRSPSSVTRSHDQSESTRTQSSVCQPAFHDTPSTNILRQPPSQSSLRHNQSQDTAVTGMILLAIS